MLIEPPYTACTELDLGRPAWPALSEAEGDGGARGAPHRLQAVKPSTRLSAVLLSARSGALIILFIRFIL